MTMECVLCVGGPSDGQWLAVQKDLNYLRLNVQVLMDDDGKWLDVPRPKQFVYKRKVLHYGKREAVTVLAPVNQSRKETLALLMKGYKGSDHGA